MGRKREKVYRIRKKREKKDWEKKLRREEKKLMLEKMRK